MDLHDDPDEHGRALDRWTAHFEAEGILSMATGARDPAPQRPAAGAVHRAVDGVRARRPRRDRTRCRLLDAARWLAAVTDEELMATQLALVDDHRLVSERVHSQGEYSEDDVRILLADNVGLSGELGPAAAAVLMGIEGGRTPARRAARASRLR